MSKKKYLIIIILAFVIIFIILDSFLAIKLNNYPIIHNKDGNGILTLRLTCEDEEKTVWKFKKINCIISSQNQSNNEQKKILLELKHETDFEEEYGLFGTEAETTEEKINIEGIKFNEVALKPYNNDEDIKFLSDFIYKKFNIRLDNKWQYYINIFNTDNNDGYITFIYYIDENISTNKAITFFFENNTINNMSYSYLDTKIEEETIIKNVNLFKEKTIQEKKQLKEDEKYLQEKTTFNYNYRINKTIYSYCLFFEQDGLINNEYGSDYIIEDFLKENNLL